MEAESGIVYAPPAKDRLSLAADAVSWPDRRSALARPPPCAGILSMYDAMGIETLLTAPTGRAAKHMSELTGREASTLHRLLGAAFSEEARKQCSPETRDDPLDCGAVVLDECSMVDTLLCVRSWPRCRRTAG